MPIETPYVLLADHQLLYMHLRYRYFFITVLNSLFYQSIEYQDAHANMMTESTVTLNPYAILLLLGKCCLYVNLFTLCSPCIMSICSFGCFPIPFRGQDFVSNYSSS